MQVLELQRRRLIRAQPCVVEGPKQRVVARRSLELTRRGDPVFEKIKEHDHAFRRGWRSTCGRIESDMAGGVELIDWIGKPDAKERFDLMSLARHQKRVKALELLDVVP